VSRKEKVWEEERKEEEKRKEKIPCPRGTGPRTSCRPTWCRYRSRRSGRPQTGPRTSTVFDRASQRRRNNKTHKKNLVAKDEHAKASVETVTELAGICRAVGKVELRALRFSTPISTIQKKKRKTNKQENTHPQKQTTPRPCRRPSPFHWPAPQQ
jgi:hypothetical protein